MFSVPYFPKHYFFTSFTSFHHVLTFSHAVQNHVDQDVCSSPACTITAQKGCYCEQYTLKKKTSNVPVQYI